MKAEEEEERPQDYVRWAMREALGVVRGQKAYGRAEDAIAEGLHAMCQAWERYDPTKGRFEPFAGERVRGAVRRYLKQERRLHAIEILYDHAEALDETLDGPGDAWARLNQAVRDGVEAVDFTVQAAEAAGNPERDEDGPAALEQLAPAERKLVELRLVNGLPWKEVGAAFGIKERAAKERLKKLREKLEAAAKRGRR